MRATDISVLAIDDEAMALDIIGEMLDQLGVVHVHTAREGRSALRAMAAMRPAPSHVIVDIYMPVMDGIEFLENLAAAKFAGGVILVSAVDIHTLALARQIAQDSGLRLTAALSKPFLKEQLAQALEIS